MMDGIIFGLRDGLGLRQCKLHVALTAVPLINVLTKIQLLEQKQKRQMSVF